MGEGVGRLESTYFGNWEELNLNRDQIVELSFPCSFGSP